MSEPYITVIKARHQFYQVHRNTFWRLRSQHLGANNNKVTPTPLWYINFTMGAKRKMLSTIKQHYSVVLAPFKHRKASCPRSKAKAFASNFSSSWHLNPIVLPQCPPSAPEPETTCMGSAWQLQQPDARLRNAGPESLVSNSTDRCFMQSPAVWFWLQLGSWYKGQHKVTLQI